MSLDGSLALSPYGGGGGPSYHQSMHLPKIGTLIPNRIFVGGIASDTTENELKHFFSAYGNVRDCKIILDRGGLSKSYGFVTFETQDDADKIIKRSADTLFLRERKLNIGPAIRKQAGHGRMYDQSVHQGGGGGNGGGSGSVVYPSAVPYSIGNGVTLMCTTDGFLIPTHQTQQAVYPSLVYHSQPGYYQSPMAAAQAATHWGNPAQWRWTTPTGAANCSVVSPGSQYLYQMPNGGPLMTSDMLFAAQSGGSPYQPPDQLTDQ